jgi:N utilization substance protein A
VSRKIKTEEKTAQHLIRNEILQVVDIVAKDKGIEKEEVLDAVEEAILKTAQLKYGSESDIIVSIDRRTGQICIRKVLTVVETVNNADLEISLSQAREKDPKIQCGGKIHEDLPGIELGRIAAQSARQTIVQKVREAERNRQYETFVNRVGDIITGVVKRIEFSNIILDIGRAEGILKKSDTIPNEMFKIEDRVKVLLMAVNKDGLGPMLQLSRTNNEFMKRLFEQEVPEVYDGLVKIVAIARDPGSKAKVAVTKSDPNLDPIGACVGVKGSRVQAICNELKGEKIDIVLWSDNVATFIVNSLSPAEVLRIVIDDDLKSVETVVPNDQLSSAIGRRGQNVRLASKLTGWNISVITEEVDAEKRAKENAKILKHFITNLDVDDMIAHLLISEGYTSIDEVAESSVSDLTSINGFDGNLAQELIAKALDYVSQKEEAVENLCKREGVQDDLKKYNVISPALLEVLVTAGIKSLNDLGDLSADELLEIAGEMISAEEANALIMDVRKNWF